MGKMRSILVLMLFNHCCLSQSTMKINDLNIPTSPAFVIMDKSPTSIEKPSNPKALSVSLINVWQNSGALEFTPYWLSDRPAYTFEDNLKKKVPLMQTFALSAATARTDSLTHIAAGCRTQVLRIYAAGITARILAKKNEIVSMLSVGQPEDIDLNAIKEAKKELNHLQSRSTFVVEVAGAYMGQSSPKTKLSSTRAGCWLNLRYSPYKIPFDFVLLGRYSWAAGSTSKLRKDSSFFDYGINLSYQNREFDLEMEYVNRRDFAGAENFDRFAIVANYQIIPGIVAVASLGKDFKKVNNVFGLLGVKFGISREMAALK